jgi:hypothetical protein
MVLLNKILRKSGVAVDKLLNEFTKEEIEIPYPALSRQMIDALVEDMALGGLIKIEKGKITATEKGIAKVDEFKKSLPEKDKKALNL